MVFRQRQKLPWHHPPHRQSEKTHYLISAACYEHRPIIGKNLSRLGDFETELLQRTERICKRVIAWCVLPNHYHLLIETRLILKVLREIGLMHGRLSHAWNGEDERRGRKVWFNCTERYMRSDRHYWATLNYVHNNAVH